MKKAKDKYENSFLCADKTEIIFTAFGVKVRKDDLDMCPPKFCHKCYKLALRGGTRLAINVWPPHKRTGNCKICSFFKDQQKPGRKKKTKPGIKPREDSAEPKEQVEMVEGMSGTLSFQPDPASLSFSEEVKNLQSFRGSEPLYPEQFVENIKHEYMCPICKEVLDQPVQTKCRTPHIFCASCLSFSFEMCGSLFSVCQTVTVNPNKFIEPAPFVLRTILSELDFQCPTCKHTVQLHQLPQHQEYCIQSPTTAPTRLNAFPKISFSKTIPPCPSETHTCSRGKGTSKGKCTISTSRTYNHHWHNNNLWGTTVSESTTN